MSVLVGKDTLAKTFLWDAAQLSDYHVDKTTQTRNFMFCNLFSFSASPITVYHWCICNVKHCKSRISVHEHKGMSLCTKNMQIYCVFFFCSSWFSSSYKIENCASTIFCWQFFADDGSSEMKMRTIFSFSDCHWHFYFPSCMSFVVCYVKHYTSCRCISWTLSHCTNEYRTLICLTQAFCFLNSVISLVLSIKTYFIPIVYIKWDFFFCYAFWLSLFKSAIISYVFF